MGLFDILNQFRGKMEKETGEPIDQINVNAAALLEDLARLGGLSELEQAHLSRGLGFSQAGRSEKQDTGTK